MRRDPALARWTELDEAHALHPADRRAIDDASSLRALVLEHARCGQTRDLFNACARLGRAQAAADASPTLAAVTLEGAARALTESGDAIDAETLAAAKAAYAEGYLAGRIERERAMARDALRYPATVVRLDATTIAVAAVHPDDDLDALAAWSGDVASRAARDGVRRAFVGGEKAARRALEDAFRVVGIDVRERLAAGDVLRLALGRFGRDD